MSRLRLAAAALLALGATGPAAAQDAFELSYGAAVTSNYIYHGATQSDDRPALQGYVEGSYGLFYGGIWSSTVDFPGDPEFGRDNFEFDLYAGIRPTFGDLSVDLSYYRYLYDHSGDCCGHVQLVLGYPVADIGEIGLEYDYDPVENTQWLEGSGSLSFASVWSVGGKLGGDFGTNGEDSDELAWDGGVNRTLGDFANVDLRWYDSNFDSGKAVVALGVDF
jgi:uncharacterized protein (TIGR02001 family)